MTSLPTLSLDALDHVLGGALTVGETPPPNAAPSIAPDSYDDAWGRGRNYCRGTRRPGCSGTRVATADQQ